MVEPWGLYRKQGIQSKHCGPVAIQNAYIFHKSKACPLTIATLRAIHKAETGEGTKWRYLLAHFSHLYKMGIPTQSWRIAMTHRSFLLIMPKHIAFVGKTDLGHIAYNLCNCASKTCTSHFLVDQDLITHLTKQHGKLVLYPILDINV